MNQERRTADRLGEIGDDGVMEGESGGWAVKASRPSLAPVWLAGLLVPAFVWLLFDSSVSTLSHVQFFSQRPLRYVVAIAGLLLMGNCLRVAVLLSCGRPLLAVRDGVVSAQTFLRLRRFHVRQISTVGPSSTGVGIVIDLIHGRPVRVGFSPAGSSWADVTTRLAEEVHRANVNRSR